MKTYYRNKSTVLRINLDTRWRWVITFMPRPPYSRSKDPQYHMDRRMGEPDSRSGRSGKGRRSHHYPWRDKNHGRPARSLACILTKLPRPACLLVIKLSGMALVKLTDKKCSLARFAYEEWNFIYISSVFKTARNWKKCHKKVIHNRFFLCSVLLNESKKKFWAHST
jgi:hypothetical protein